MDKKELLELLEQNCVINLKNNFTTNLSDEEFEIILYVYHNHPLFIGNKYDVARGYAALGVDLFKMLYPIAKQFGDLWDKCVDANHLWLGLVADAETARKAGLDKLAERLDKKAELAKAADKRYTDEYKALLHAYNLDDYIDL